MKIISGFLKGRILKGHDVVGTRPTISRVKESMFGMIQSKIPSAIVLDLFAGSGSLGIEAISNGSSHCYLVDNNKKMFDILKANIKDLKIEEKTTLLNKGFIESLIYLKDNNIKLDMIFLDPPYKTDYIKDAINLILEYNLANDDALIVCESDDYTKLKDITLPIYKERKYGDKWVVIYDIL